MCGGNDQCFHVGLLLITQTVNTANRSSANFFLIMEDFNSSIICD